jgi:predicted DNA-binding transcriptional regulator AlpA
MQIYPVKEVLRRTSLGSRSSLWRAVKAGTFPAPYVIGANRIGWSSDDVENWANALPKRDYRCSGATEHHIASLSSSKTSIGLGDET